MNIDIKDDNEEVTFEKRETRFMKSNSARKQREKIKQIKQIKEKREQKENEHLLKKHETLVKAKKQKHENI